MLRLPRLQRVPSPGWGKTNRVEFFKERPISALLLDAFGTLITASEPEGRVHLQWIPHSCKVSVVS